MSRPPPQLLSILPAFLVGDVRRTQAFYRDVLGLAHGGVWGDEPNLFGIAGVDGLQGFHFKSAPAALLAPRPRPAASSDADGPPLDAYVRMAAEHVQPLYVALAKRGIPILRAPKDQPWGQRELLLRDPDGHVLCFGGDLTGEWPSKLVTICPEWTVSDPLASGEFLRQALGFPIVDTWGDPPAYAIARREGATLHLRRATAPEQVRGNAGAGVWDAYVRCTGVDELASELQRRGVPLERGPEDKPYGMREFDVLDPDGYVLCFGEDVGGDD